MSRRRVPRHTHAAECGRVSRGAGARGSARAHAREADLLRAGDSRQQHDGGEHKCGAEHGKKSENYGFPGAGVAAGQKSGPDISG